MVSRAALRSAMHLLAKVTWVFLSYKCVQLVLVALTPSTFDTSLEILLESDGKVPVLGKLLRWDAVYFVDLAVNGLKYEHQYVFCPLWWRIVRALPGTGLKAKLLGSVVVSNAMHYVAVWLMMLVTRHYMARPSDAFTWYTGVAAVIAPAGIFLTAGYSENLGNVLTFLQMWLYANAFTSDYRKGRWRRMRSKPMYMLSGLVLALNFMVRANSMFYGIFYIFDVVEAVFYDGDLKRGAWAVGCGLQLFAAIVGQSWWAYRQFCPERGEWCRWRVPVLFSYAQKQYWNVGFLRYWLANNIPNFVVAMPVLYLNVLTMMHFVRELPKRPRLAPLLVVNGLTVAGALLFWNVQIINRVSSFLPLPYWYLASELERGRGRWWVMYMISYGLIQTVLFAAFLPPA